MHEDAIKDIERICDLVDQKKLPKSAIPRLFYMGHKVLHGFASDEKCYKCIACGKESHFTRENFKKIPNHCECGGCDADFFDITPDEESRWECIQCQHQWTSHDGTKCPACGDIQES